MSQLCPNYHLILYNIVIFCIYNYKFAKFFIFHFCYLNKISEFISIYIVLLFMILFEYNDLLS